MVHGIDSTETYPGEFDLIGTRQCTTTKQQVFTTYLFNWFILDNFVLGQIGVGNRWSVWTYPRDSHGLRPGNHGQRSCGTGQTSFLA